jgi:hypothetical protein
VNSVRWHNPAPTMAQLRDVMSYLHTHDQRCTQRQYRLLCAALVRRQFFDLCPAPASITEHSYHLSVILSAVETQMTAPGARGSNVRLDLPAAAGTAVEFLSKHLTEVARLNADIHGQEQFVNNLMAEAGLRLVSLLSPFRMFWMQYSAVMYAPDMVEVPTYFGETPKQKLCRTTLALLRDVMGDPFAPTTLCGQPDCSDLIRRPESELLPCSACQALRIPLAQEMTDVILQNRAHELLQLDRVRLQVLADVLEDSGCQNTLALSHLREASVHVPGCWVIELIRGSSSVIPVFTAANAQKS